MWKKWTYILSRHPGRDPWSAGNNKKCGRNGLTSCQRHPGRDPWSAGNKKECGRNGLTPCQGTQAEIHGQLGTTMNVEEMDLHTVKAPSQRSMVSWEQQRMWKKWTYSLSRHPGRDPWSAGNNKECGR